MRLYRLDAAMAVGLAVSIFLGNFAAFGRECAQVRQDVVRLHIMANSDGAEDQRVKLRVRDRVLEEVGGVFRGPQSQEDAKRAAREALPAIESAAKAELAAQGSDAPVRAELTRMYFTTRQYEGLSLPAGMYDAVRVTIGSGSGRNWWCVMYPPICVTAAAAPQSRALDEIETLNGEPLFKPKLALVELFERLAAPKKEAPAGGRDGQT